VRFGLVALLRKTCWRSGDGIFGRELIDSRSGKGLVPLERALESMKLKRKMCEG